MGVTPWGTYLTCEENFHVLLRRPEELRSGPTWRGSAARGHRGRRAVGAEYWRGFKERFDLTKNPNEPNRFGWVVEIDPFDPQSTTPVKRTALGR